MSDYSNYEIVLDQATGYQVVYFQGRKIGQTQTPAGARLIRRNHARRSAR